MSIQSVSRLAPYQEEDAIRRVLENSRSVAIVGLSRNTVKDSHMVAAYLQKQGYRVVPIHPVAGEILGERIYASLLDVPFTVDLVDVFRPASEAKVWIDQAIKRGLERSPPPAIWLQFGIINLDEAERARAAGLTVIMDKCTMVEHRRLLGASGDA